MINNEGTAIPHRSLVELIEKNADRLSRHCLKDIRSHPGTKTYHTYDETELYERAYIIYSQLGRWISQQTSKEEIAEDYMTLGAKRYDEGFSLSEVIQALIITRRQLWLEILREGFLDTVLDLHQAMELNNKVLVFFDRAIFFTSIGYEKRCREKEGASG